MSDDKRIMEEYRGPSKQYPKVERKFFIRIVVGIVIILLGILGQQITIELSNTTVMVQGPDPGAGPSEIESGIDVTRTCLLYTSPSPPDVEEWRVRGSAGKK